MKSKRRAGFDPNHPVKTAVKAVLAPWAHPTGNISSLHLRARGKTQFWGRFGGTRASCSLFGVFCRRRGRVGSGVPGGCAVQRVGLGIFFRSV